MTQRSRSAASSVEFDWIASRSVKCDGIPVRRGRVLMSCLGGVPSLRKAMRARNDEQGLPSFCGKRILNALSQAERRLDAPLIQRAAEAVEPGGNLIEPADELSSRMDAGSRRLLVVGVGASAGGLEAFTRLLKGLPEDPGLALVLILHLAPDRPSGIAEVLSHSTSLAVCEATDGMQLERNHVYVIPPNAGMTLSGSSLCLHPRPGARTPHRPVDAFLSSLAEAEESNAIGVVLSGSDVDGRQGLQEIKRRRGITFAQDESAGVPGMPESSIATGAVDFILPPDAIAIELARLAQQARFDVVEESDPVTAAAEAALSKGNLEEILRLLRDASGVDFTHYKMSTVRRRILRRMGLHRIENVAHFLELLRGSEAEVKSLYSDILIHVTHFFRDPDAFSALKTLAIPHLVETVASPREPIRIWVPGCATGEEVYSIAICMCEALGIGAGSVPIQIFGTDISESAIAKARAGIYAEDVTNDVSPERLRKFFVRTDAGFQVSKALRDLCVFAKHDMVRDPPFSRIDLISCRNVLIYMTPLLQKRIIPLFHYGLNPHGYLLLGSAESISSFPELFNAVDPRWNLYAKVEGSVRPRSPRAAPQRTGPIRGVWPRKGAAPRESEVRGEVNRLLVDTYAPPCVLINDQLEVLHLHGRTAPYLELAPGKPSLHLLAMAREGIQAAVYHAVHAALESDTPSDATAHLTDDGREVRIRVTPLGNDISSVQRCLLVAFEEGSAPPLEPQPVSVPGSVPETAQALTRSRREIEALRVQLQSMIEGYEAAHEELQTANEEVLSSNEELQSTNEELQTSKEELESANEELSTINDELQARVGELGRLHDDVINVLASVQVSMVILGPDLAIRSFTPAAAPLFNLIPSDVGRPLSDINIGIRIHDIAWLLTDVLDTLSERTQSVQDATGRWYTLRVRPYHTRENRTDGVVLVLIDIDEIQRAGDRIAAARDYAEAIVATVRRPLLVLDAKLRVHNANPAFYRTFGVLQDEAEGRSIYELGNGQWDIPELRRLLEEVLTGDRHFDDFQVDHTFPRIGHRTMLINARRVEGPVGVESLILVAIDDVTDRHRHDLYLEDRDRQLVAADVRKNEFLSMLAHELRNPLAPVVHAAGLLRTTDVRDATSIGHATDIIVRQATHMARLIEDLLDVARITRGKVDLRKVRLDLRSAVESAVEMSQPLIEARGHDLDVSLGPEPLEVDADPARLNQIIGNLLVNAANYTDPGGRIELRVQRESSWAVVRVQDCGIGIPAELLPRIFELYAQGDPKLNRRSGGLGIGLTVVRSLVELHGGTIEARSDGAGRGSEFIVRIPHAAPSEAEPRGVEAGSLLPSTAQGSTPQESHQVLIVEDDADVSEALSCLLTSWGHQVRAVRDGPQALDAVQRQAPALVMIDIGLPGMNGYDLASALRRIPNQRRPWIVALTGHGQEQDRRRSREAGFDQHLVKPVQIETLRELLKNVKTVSPARDGAPDPEVTTPSIALPAVQTLG